MNDNDDPVASAEDGQYVPTAWENVCEGAQVLVREGQEFPADMVLLNSSCKDGSCWIKTQNLDGETNLKTKRSVGISETFTGTLECVEPNKDLDMFHGYILETEGDKVCVTNNSLLLRGCTLVNTGFIHGLIVYTGHNTKIMMNAASLRYKKSRMEKQMNWDVVLCAIILVIICLISAVGAGLSEAFNFSDNFLNIYGNPTYALNAALLAFLTFIIIYQVIIPLSLYVIIDLIKISHVYFINNDNLMKNKRTGKGAHCRTLNIPEDLGKHAFDSEMIKSLPTNMAVYCYTRAPYWILS